MVWISCTTNPHHIVAQLTLSSCITNGHYHQAQQLHLSVCPQWSDFILRLRQSGLKSHTAIQPPSRNKKVVCYFSTRFQPWLGIVTVNTTPSYNMNCLFLSVPTESNYGKAKRTKGSRNAIRDSLHPFWLGSTLPSQLLDDLFVTQRVGIELVWKECMPIAAAARSRALVYGRSPQQRGVLCRIIGYCAGRKAGVWGTVRCVAYITIDDTNLALWTNW